MKWDKINFVLLSNNALITICFVLGLADFGLTIFLLDTGLFAEANFFAYPYFLVIPLMIFLNRKDKFTLGIISILSIFLSIVVSINLINLFTFMRL